VVEDHLWFSQPTSQRAAAKICVRDCRALDAAARPVIKDGDFADEQVAAQYRAGSEGPGREPDNSPSVDQEWLAALSEVARAEAAYAGARTRAAKTAGLADVIVTIWPFSI
jgi:hypothetical protein